MSKKLSPLRWFPPAETKIPLAAFASFFHSDIQTATNSLRLNINSAHCLLGPSGRGLLCRLLEGLYEKNGKTRNEVLIPAYTCYSVAASVVKAGLRVRLYDLMPASLDAVCESLEENCNKQVLAVISQHLMGIPSNVDQVALIAESNGLYHIEDAAQALGGQFKNRHLGTIGDYGLFSFSRGKPLPLGAGGALISNLVEFETLPLSFASHRGWRTFLISILSQAMANPNLYGIAEKLPLGLGKTVFDPDFEIEKIPRFLMTLLTPMLAYMEQLNNHRRAIASVYQHIVPSTHTISNHEDSVPVYPRYPVLAKPGSLPADLIRLGVRRLYPKPLNHERRITPYILNPDHKFPGAQCLAERLVSLPTHHDINFNIAECIGGKVLQWING